MIPFGQDEKYQEGAPRSADDVAGNEPSIIISPDTRRGNRIPPGQSRTRKWPVLHYGYVPTVTTAAWRLEVFGLVKTPLKFTWSAPVEPTAAVPNEVRSVSLLPP